MMVSEKVEKDLTAERLRDRKNGKGRCTKEVQSRGKSRRKDGAKKLGGRGRREEVCMQRFEGKFSLYKFLRSEVGKVGLADRRLTGRLDSRQSLYLTYSFCLGPRSPRTLSVSAGTLGKGESTPQKVSGLFCSVTITTCRLHQAVSVQSGCRHLVSHG